MGIVAGFKLLLKNLGLYNSILGRVIQVVFMVVVVYLGYALYLRLFEKRKPTEYSTKGCFRELAYGMGIGAGLVTFQVLILWIAGIYQINEVVISDGIIRFLLLNIVIGFSEELASRGIIFRILEEGLGSWIALLISATEIGLTHVTNTGATFFSTFAVSIEFGVMLVLFYMITRRLWLVTGFHFAWNFAMGGIFGINVSGTEANGLFLSQMEGPSILTGGTFGIEASIISVVLCSIVSVFLAVRVVKMKYIIGPIWVRQ